MGRLTGVVAKANQLVGKINPHYDLTSGNIQEIHREYGGNLNLSVAHSSLGICRE